MSNPSLSSTELLEKGREEMLSLIWLLQEPDSHFDDLGKLLLGGVIAAIVVAVAFTVIRMKLRDNKPASSSFVSIGSTENNPGK